jgi:hypothetical protein
MLGVLGRTCIRWNGVCVCVWSRHGEYLDTIFNGLFETIASTFSWILLRFLGKSDMVSKKHSTRSYCSMCVRGQASLIERGTMSFLFLVLFSILVMCTFRQGFGMDSCRKWLIAKFVMDYFTYLSSVWGCQSVSIWRHTYTQRPYTGVGIRVCGNTTKGFQGLVERVEHRESRRPGPEYRMNDLQQRYVQRLTF